MNAIEVVNVSKRFRIPHERRTTLAERLVGMFRTHEVETLEALSDVSLQVPWGSFVGIIGANGSGKSTLLKLMAGLFPPDSGRLLVQGTLVPLLELGLGFQQELSVRENVELYGAVLGYSRSAMARKVDEAIAFAGLERFRDAKLKSLSSGMMVRLAFATALRADADTAAMAAPNVSSAGAGAPAGARARRISHRSAALAGRPSSSVSVTSVKRMVPSPQRCSSSCSSVGTSRPTCCETPR